jgi:2-keto-4-pentenoate hydratase/2-oxohepta-3-ene-1,7-dioic acid hydratase in catechol pathway
MRLRTTTDGPIVHDTGEDRWVAIRGLLDRADSPSDDLIRAAGDGLLGLLQAEALVRDELQALLSAHADDSTLRVDPAGAGLPFEARSLRAFMVYPGHLEQSSRILVKRFFPPPIARLMTMFERTTGRTFPPLKPNEQFYASPPMYVGNHAAMLPDGRDVWWPSYTEFLDFELELACVLGRPLSDATPAEARDAIGGWFVLNDWSARDVQAEDARHSVFGPVVKSKTFANSMGADVVTADELPDWRTATGRVLVDGELWCEGATAGTAWDIGDMLAHASKGEYLAPGDVFSTGTMPGCCGLELDRWITPGQTVRLEIDGVGDLTTTVSATATPASALGPA